MPLFSTALLPHEKAGFHTHRYFIGELMNSCLLSIIPGHSIVKITQPKVSKKIRRVFFAAFCFSKSTEISYISDNFIMDVILLKGKSRPLTLQFVLEISYSAVVLAVKHPKNFYPSILTRRQN